VTAPDFLPLEPGTRLEYAVSRARETRNLVVEHLAAAGGGVIVRRTWTAPDGTAESDTSRAERRPDGVYFDGVLTLPLPTAVGAAWSSPPRVYRVESLDASAGTPAGDFRGCLRVVYLIAGGDAGAGERLYAPGLGLVRETCRDEADPFEVLLTAFVPAAVAERQ
jgi:hypothetical protein